MASEKFSFHFLMFLGRRHKNEKLGNILKLNLLLWMIFAIQIQVYVWVKFLHDLTFFKKKKKKKLYGPFLWMGFSCLKASESLQGDSLLFTTRSPSVPSTNLMDPGRMKQWVDLGASQWFSTQEPWIGNPAP